MICNIKNMHTLMLRYLGTLKQSCHDLLLTKSNDCIMYERMKMICLTKTQWQFFAHSSSQLKIPARTLTV